jgi:membrane protein YqaA with SNARE-associated domain
MRKLYDWTMRQASGPHAGRGLFWVSFIESSVFPIPPDVMLVPMILANRLKAWWYAWVATIGSVIGGVAGYAIGYFLFEAIGEPVMRFYGYTGKFDQVTDWFNEWGVWILIIKGMTPFPYKVLTILAGVAHMNLLEFILASIIARAMRFYLVAALLYRYGEPIRRFIEERLMLVTTVFAILLVGGFVAIKFFV